MIRKITPEDRDVFFVLTREFYASPAVLHDVPDRYHADVFEEMMRSDVYAGGYILEYEGNIAGYALTAKTYSHDCGGLALWLEELYIREPYRSHGLGSEFFAYIINSHPEVRRFRLEVEPDNVRAIALYKRQGFEPLDYYQMVRDEK